MARKRYSPMPGADGRKPKPVTRVEQSARALFRRGEYQNASALFANEGNHADAAAIRVQGYERGGRKEHSLLVAAARTYAALGRWKQVNPLLGIINELMESGEYKPGRTAREAISALKKEEFHDPVPQKIGEHGVQESTE